MAGIRATRRKGLGTLWSKCRRVGVWRLDAGLPHDAGTGFLSTPLRGAPKNPGTLPRAKKHATGMFFAAAVRPPPFRVPSDAPKSGPPIRMTRFLVRAWGLEPQRVAREPKSRMSTNSIMPAKSPCFYTAGEPRQSILLDLRIYPSINGNVCQSNGRTFSKREMFCRERQWRNAPIS